MITDEIPFRSLRLAGWLAGDDETSDVSSRFRSEQ
jgi:hypothetical protein